MQLKIVSEEDVRWFYLYDSWAVILRVLGPVPDDVKQSIFKLVMLGFESVKSRRPSQRLTQAALDTDKEQSMT